jgi:hypothetical protein
LFHHRDVEEVLQVHEETVTVMLSVSQTDSAFKTLSFPETGLYFSIDTVSYP